MSAQTPISLSVPFLVQTDLPAGNVPISPTQIARWPGHSAFAAANNSVWIVPAAPPRRAPLPHSPTRPSRRRKAFSPPPATPTLSSPAATTAVAAPADHHAHGSGQSLRGQLRDQYETRDATAMALGLGRRGLPGVHGQAEQHSGAASPKSIMSVSTDTAASTNGGMFGFWRGNAQSADEERVLQEKIEEIEVERAMERESREDRREMEERRVVGHAIGKSPNPGNESRSSSRQQSHGHDSQDRIVRRLVLRSAGTGKIVDIKAYPEAGVLCVLRDQGLMDVFSLDTLQSVASLNLEGPTSSPQDPSGSKPGKLGHYWSWRGLCLAKSGTVCMMFAHGLPWPCGSPSPNGQVTQVAVMIYDKSKFSPLQLVTRTELPGEGKIGTLANANDHYLIHATMTSLTSYPILFPTSTSSSPSANLLSPPSTQTRISSSAHPRSQTPSPVSSDQTTSHIRKSASSSNLPFRSSPSPSPTSTFTGEHHEDQKGFAKFLARRDWGRKKEEQHPVEERPKVGLGEGKEVERDGYGHWTGFRLDESGEGLGWGEDGVDVFKCDGKSMWITGSITWAGKCKAKQGAFTHGWEKVAILREDGVLDIWSHDGEKREGSRLKFASVDKVQNVQTISLCGPNGNLLLVHDDTVSSIDLSSTPHDHNIYLKLDPPSSAEKKGMYSHIVPSSVEDAFVTDPQGNIYHRSLDSVITQNAQFPETDHPSIDRLDSPVTCMKIVQGSEEGARRYLVVGDEDGVVRVWAVNNFTFCGSWTLFAWPVQSLALLDIPQAGHLRGALLCTSRAGTVGLISLAKMEHLSLIPAARSPLRDIYISEKDILLAYTNGKARVWNTETQEFRRSTGLDAAEDMLQIGDWARVELEAQEQDIAIRAAVHEIPQSDDIGRLLSLDLRALGRWLHSSKNNPHHSPLGALRTLLSVFLTWGVNDAVDETCAKQLAIHRPAKESIVGYGDQSIELAYVQGVGAWNVSGNVTGLRQLTIITLLRPFLDSPDHERWAAEVIAFYTATLPATVTEPDLDFFASFYMDISPDVHMAARMLFAARVDRLVESEIEAIVDSLELHLPNHQSGETRFGQAAVNAFTVLGGIALQRYQCMRPSALKALSDSVDLYLHQPNCIHLPLAIEICSKGFATWQTYVDPSDLLRRLFHLATNKEPPSKSSRSSISLAAQARLAVLHVATSNTPLFMSTLSMDILDAKSAEARSSIMRLCVFMARKRPAVLENGLPRIAEAVVKSLDPTLGKMRDDVWQAATVILNELVLAFSTIDFHSGTQRLAVGTHEGAVIMYDLKTASRLYILEPHKFPVSAVCFSPDGRRLLTVSIEEGSVTVWKVGSSLSGFFNVGGPPRQGGKAGDPFKRIEFIRADDRPLDSTAALSDVRVAWPAARQARVTIKETALTFET